MAMIQSQGHAVYTTVASGAIAGSVSAAQLPDVKCRLVQFKALSANAGKVYLGASSGVTKATPGSTDTTSGIQLSPGDFSPWIPVNNLNVLWLISDNTNDTLTYLALD